MNEQHGSGLVTVSVLAMILTGLISGALIGMVLGRLIESHLVLAIVSAIVAAILALVIRSIVLERNVASTMSSSIDLMWVVVASLIGGLAGLELATDLSHAPPLPLMGALSGLVASVLIASFAATVFVLRNSLSLPDE